jgi:hypothetical protein
MTDGQLPTVEQPTDKLYIVNNRLILAGTGQHGLGQRFHSILQQIDAQANYSTHTAINIAMTFCQQAIQNFRSTAVPAHQYGALVAFPSAEGPSLCEFASADFQPEMMNDRFWYDSMGSAKHITDTFLALMREVYWRDGRPTLSEARFALTWALDHAVQINPGGVNGPVRIAVLDSDASGPRARILDDTALAEHRQQIEEAKQALRDVRAKYIAGAAASVPEVPRPSPA